MEELVAVLLLTAANPTEMAGLPILLGVAVEVVLSQVLLEEEGLELSGLFPIQRWSLTPPYDPLEEEV